MKSIIVILTPLLEIVVMISRWINGFPHFIRLWKDTQYLPFLLLPAFDKDVLLKFEDI
jgi:hypothetical protein